MFPHFRPRVPVLPVRRVLLFPLRSLDALFALGSGTAAISLYLLGSNLSLGSLLSGWSLFARRSARSLFAPFSSGSHRSLNGGIGSAGVLSISPAIAAAILHNNLPLIG